MRLFPVFHSTIPFHHSSSVIVDYPIQGGIQGGRTQSQNPKQISVEIKHTIFNMKISQTMVDVFSADV